MRGNSRKVAMIEFYPEIYKTWYSLNVQCSNTLYHNVICVDGVERATGGPGVLRPLRHQHQGT